MKTMQHVRQIQHMYNVFMNGLSPVITVVLVGLLMVGAGASGTYLYNHYVESEKSIPDTELIDCFVNGNHIKATEKSCIELSKPKYSSPNTVSETTKDTAQKVMENKNPTTGPLPTSKYVEIFDFVGQAIYCEKAQVALISEKGAVLKSLKEKVDRGNEQMQDCIDEWSSVCKDIDDEEIVDNYDEYQGKVKEYENLLSTYCLLE